MGENTVSALAANAAHELPLLLKLMKPQIVVGHAAAAAAAEAAKQVADVNVCFQAVTE